MTTEPDPDLTTRLGQAAARFVSAAGHRRLLAPRFHLGTPGGSQLTLTEDPGLDAGLRADLVERILDSVGTRERVVAWLTRSGALTGTDSDYAWFAAAREGFGRHGLALPGFFVITLQGCFDLRTGVPVDLSRQ